MMQSNASVLDYLGTCESTYAKVVERKKYLKEKRVSKNIQVILTCAINVISNLLGSNLHNLMKYI